MAKILIIGAGAMDLLFRFLALINNEVNILELILKIISVEKLKKK